MRLNHIAIWVNDLENMRSFYMSYFKMICGELYINPKKRFSSYFLSFEEGARIELMKKENMSKNSVLEDRPGLTHMAISVGSKSQVDILTESLRKDGYRIAGEPRITGDGFYESVIVDPEGNKIEITE